jgi:hypothetical protein
VALKSPRPAFLVERPCVSETLVQHPNRFPEDSVCLIWIDIAQIGMITLAGTDGE